MYPANPARHPSNAVSDKQICLVFNLINQTKNWNISTQLTDNLNCTPENESVFESGFFLLVERSSTVVLMMYRFVCNLAVY